ncbi:hypothetical protein ACW7G0_07585 [Lysobacter sp. A286]
MGRLVDQIKEEISSHKPAFRPTEREPKTLLVREGGLPDAPSGVRDSFEARVELMEVVEARR